jgi:hypothetical protein
MNFIKISSMLAVLLAVACSEKQAATPSLPSSTAGSGGALPGAGSGGAPATGGRAETTGGASIVLFGGATGTNSGGSGDSAGGGTGGDSVMVVEKCAATQVPSKDLTMTQPADIIFAIDSSRSMDEEIQFVQTEMNAFSQQIVAAGVDVRVILIGDERAICIGAPLGSGQCPGDSKMPNYIHIDQMVDSRNALDLFISTFPLWSQYLRPEASKSFVVISDDDATDRPINTAEAFTTAVAGLDPTLFAKWTMNGVYCFTDCPESAAIGTRYATLVQQTMGVGGDLCLQDFKPVFDQLAKSIVTNAGVQIACEWDLQPPQAMQSYSGDLVQVTRVATAGDTMLNRVLSQAECGAAGGWYFDSNLNPTKILACPDTCSGIQNQTGGAIDITFGCETVGSCIASGSSSLGAMPGACEWALPEAPQGQTVSLDAVNVRYTSASGFASELGKVATAADCAQVAEGWYYDDPANPTKIIACPQTCSQIKEGGVGSKVDALFGCQSKPAVPR